ncbi:hypothetical protein V8C35DRAFT_317316 [Trichoderma chlorosporum]
MMTFVFFFFFFFSLFSSFLIKRSRSGCSGTRHDSIFFRFPPPSRLLLKVSICFSMHINAHAPTIHHCCHLSWKPHEARERYRHHSERL